MSSPTQSTEDNKISLNLTNENVAVSKPLVGHNVAISGLEAAGFSGPSSFGPADPAPEDSFLR